MSSAVDVTESIDIEPPTTELARRVSSSLGLSNSPLGTFHTPPWTKTNTQLNRYGHIGSQLSVLAEAFGMKVLFFDAVNLMAMGTAKQVPTLEALLRAADFVTCHVPELPETTDMIAYKEFDYMKDGSYLINASRGHVINIPALIDSMRSGKVAGAALDVYPAEPGGNGDYFSNDLNPWAEDLRGLKNIILTPHIGGSTEEAQSAIGIEVGQALVHYVNEGTTLGAVNMPEVNLRVLTMDEPNHVRVAYLMADISNVNVSVIKNLYQGLESLSSRIMTRVLY
ncbi:hypothetical protein P7C71_g992, partial [Lecanoromycetidae sp. Uapishka_2]